MLGETFWEDVPPLDIITYATGVEAKSPVASSVAGRDCEVQALSQLALMRTRAEPEFLNAAFQSRVNTRRKFFGEWSNDGGPFSEAEVLVLREQVTPWEFSPEFVALLERVFRT